VSDEQKNVGMAGSAAMVLALIPLLCVTYLFSVGPMVMLYRVTGQSPVVGSAIESFYAPVEWAYRNTAARDSIRWYVSLWD